MEVFAWPLVVFLLGVIGMFFFKRPIQRLIDRAEKVGKGGIQARALPEQATEPKSSGVEDFLKKVYDNQLLREAEEGIRTHLESLKPVNVEERERFLLRNFAATVILRAFDRIYYDIYGSQLAALQFLNDFRGAQVTLENLRPFFEEACKKHPELYINDRFERWLGFISTAGLVRLDNNIFSITVRGKEFLKYLVDQGRTFLKSG